MHSTFQYENPILWCLVELKQNHSSRKLTLSILLNREVFQKWLFSILQQRWALFIRTYYDKTYKLFTRNVNIQALLLFDNYKLVRDTITLWKGALEHSMDLSLRFVDLLFSLIFWDFNLFVVICTHNIHIWKNGLTSTVRSSKRSPT